MKWWQRWLCFFIFAGIYSLSALLPYVGLFGFDTVANVFREDSSQWLILFQPFYEVAFPWLLILLMSVPVIKESFNSGVLGTLESVHFSHFSEGSGSTYSFSSRKLFYTLFWCTLLIAGTTCFADYMVGASVYGQYDDWGYILSCFPSALLSSILSSVLLFFVYRWVRLGVLWFASKFKSFETYGKLHFWVSWGVLIFALLFWCSYSMYSFYAAFSFNITTIMIPYLVSNFLATPVLFCVVNRTSSSVWPVLGVGVLYSVFYFLSALVCTVVIHVMM